MCSSDLLTFAHIVIGEMVPKALALQQADRTVLYVTPPIRVLERMLLPLVVSLNALGNGILHIAGFRRQRVETERYHTSEELQYIIRESQEGGLLRGEGGTILRELFEFGDLTAGEILVPRVQLNGIPVGAYHFADVTKTPTQVGGARAEAEWFVANGAFRAGDLPPVLDIEQNNGLGTVALTDWVMAWLERVRQLTGIYPMIYTSPGGWNSRFGSDGNVVAQSGYGLLWVADWRGNASPAVPANNWDGRGWTFWQYTSSGSVPGISGNVDLDYYREPTPPTGLLLRSLAITKASVGGKSGGVQQDGLGGFCNGACTATTRLSVGGATTTLTPNSLDTATSWTWGGDCAGAQIGRAHV